MRKPHFITFTGWDKHTNLEEAAKLSKLYPIEWGVLASEGRQGKEPRYPDLSIFDVFDKPKWLDSWSKLKFSVHLCGRYARNVVNEDFDFLDVDSTLSSLLTSLRLFTRVQINYRNWTDESLSNVSLFSELIDVPCIIQWNKEFPIERFHYGKDDYSDPDYRDTGDLTLESEYLYDLSGGTGQSPSSWPKHPGGKTCVGYAGGIGPDNVLDVIKELDCQGLYWLDMESKIRTDDILDLSKCRSVCEQVYGVRS